MKNISRRNFLAKTSVFGLLASTIQFLPSRILAKGAVAPSNRMNVGFIGVGLIAKGHWQFVASSPRTQLMALCDVNQTNLKRTQGSVNAAAKKNSAVPFREVDTYEHYEELVDRDDIDTVWICTPDHWHVQLAVAALLKGKSVYVEKPMSLTVEEGRILADTVKKTKGVLQVGCQQRSDDRFKTAAQLVRNGYLGKIKSVDVGIGTFPAEPTGLKEEAIPAGFNYEKWLGHTPWRPFNSQRVLSKYSGGWRCFLEYGARKEGDWGAHHFDIVQWALGRDTSGPTEFYPVNSNDAEAARHYKYDTGEIVYVNDAKRIGRENIIKFHGEEGDLHVNRNMISCTIPGLLKQPLQANDVALQTSLDHRENFLDAIAYGKENIAQAETGHRTATICQLLSIARRTNESFKWDPKTETVTDGSTKVKSMLSRPRRAPYFIGA